MSQLKSPEKRRKAACVADFLLCLAGVYFAAPELNYYAFGATLILTVIIYESITTALFQRTLGLALFGFQVKLSGHSDIWIASIKRSLLYVWHIFVVFWPESPESSVQTKTSQGLVVYKWDSGSGTYLRDQLKAGVENV